MILSIVLHVFAAVCTRQQWNFVSASRDGHQ